MLEFIWDSLRFLSDVFIILVWVAIPFALLAAGVFTVRCAWEAGG